MIPGPHLLYGLRCLTRAVTALDPRPGQGWWTQYQSRIPISSRYPHLCEVLLVSGVRRDYINHTCLVSTGRIWDGVYSTLDAIGVPVVCGRATGVPSPQP